MSRRRSFRRQQGAALLISLVFLLLMVVGAHAAVRGATHQQRQVANLVQRQLGFQAAESALRTLEAQIRAQQLALPGQACSGADCNLADAGWQSLASAAAGVAVVYRVDWLGTSAIPAQLQHSGQSQVYRLVVRTETGRRRTELEAMYALAYQ
ncbi:pilus assembly PilX family protein [Pseudomonas sp.]|uniref:pilus assembly PilX family protein n=1 Tax=Pseudomonas sp. TaxID=306 RepID=UPI000C8F3CC8|nr:hypothetical protein [Pseudomonadales bacterium]|tara:strand:+ start:1616 stop:2074 length:459 start_codon:yes stop_codon:yes gene_type:complete